MTPGELIAAAIASIERIGCDNRKPGDWCGKCGPCFERQAWTIRQAQYDADEYDYVADDLAFDAAREKR